MLGPNCTDYLKEGGCCLKAAGTNASAISACQQLSAQYADAIDPAQAEASCKAANDAAVAAGQCDAPAGDLSPSTACANYLACIVKVTPEAFPAALMSYGPRSQCWTSPAIGAQCTQACQGALDNLRKVPSTAAIPECSSCADDSDCWSAQPACDTASKRCVLCVNDTYCAASPSGHVCSPETQSCVECNLGTQCPSHNCTSHKCADGCYIDGAYRTPSSANPANACQSCQPGTSVSVWTALADNTSCGTGLACESQKCVQKFNILADGTTDALRALWGTGSMNVYAVGTKLFISRLILHTKDGGKTWYDESYGPVVSPGLNAMWGSSATEVYIVGNTGYLQHTSDGFKNITEPMVGTMNHLLGVWGSSASDVYIVGAAGTILRTTDGSKTFTALTSGTTNNLTAVWGSGASDIYAVGAAGTILHTSDSGATWTALTSGTTSDLAAIWGSSNSDVWVAGSAGTVLHSTDGGKTWAALTSGATANLTGVWGSSASDVYFVGTAGTILHTTDGGKTFSQAYTNTTKALAGIWGSGSGDIYAVGAGGITLHFP
jgi:photosystem II stability/assembly factor-like uncharacterized protein